MANELELFHPFTGELIDVRDMPKIAETISNIRTVKQQLTNILDALTDAVVEESQRLGTKTMHVGKVTVELSTDHEIEWDIDVLSQLVGSAGLPEERWEQLVQTVVTYKVDGRVAKQLASSNESYKKIIEYAQTKIPKKQYVKLKRLT